MSRVLINAYSAVAGGAVTYLTELVPRLTELMPRESFGLIVSDRARPKLKGLAATNLEVHPLEATSNPARQLVVDNVHINRIARRGDYDLLVSIGNRGPFFPSSPHILYHRDASVFVDWSGNESLRRSWRLRRRICTALARRASTNVVPSEYMSGVLVDAAKLDVAPEILPHGCDKAIDGGPLSRSDLSLGGRHHSYTFLCAAGPAPHKDMITLVKAFGSFAEEANARLLLTISDSVPDYFGGQDYARDLVELCRDTARVEMLGELSPIGLDRIMADVDAVISPSLIESFGMTILEAARHGVHVICSDIPAHIELAAPDTTFFEAGSGEQLVQALHRSLLAIDRSDSADRIAHAKGFSWDETAAKTADLIAKSLKLARNDAWQLEQRSYAT